MTGVSALSSTLLIHTTAVLLLAVPAHGLSCLPKRCGKSCLRGYRGRVRFLHERTALFRASSFEEWLPVLALSRVDHDDYGAADISGVLALRAAHLAGLKSVSAGPGQSALLLRHTCQPFGFRKRFANRLTIIQIRTTTDIPPTSARGNASIRFRVAPGWVGCVLR